MRRARRSAAVVALLLAAFAPAPGAGAELRDGQVIRFTVSDAATGEALYSGVEHVSIDARTVHTRTVYRAEGRGEVKIEEVRYDLDTLEVDAFTSEDRAGGERVALRRAGKQLLIEYVARQGGETVRDDRLKWGAETRLGKTLHPMIVRHWDELVAGRAVSFDLLVPSKFESYRFRLVQQPRSPAGNRVFRLEPEAWLVRQFVPPMDFHYDEVRRAVQYEGPSTVDYEGNPKRRVVIRFSY
jgi:hypothetical protein